VATLWRLVAATGAEWYRDRAQRMGAALAFYTVFALAPGLVIVVAVTGLLIEPTAARSRIVEQFHLLAGPDAASAIDAVIEATDDPAAGALATRLAVLALVLGLWGVFGELQDALNSIWQVTPRPARNLAAFLRQRLWSLTTVLGTGFLLLVSLVISAWLAALGKFFQGLLPVPAALLEAAHSLVSLGGITGLFALMFKVLPDVEVPWRDVWPGALLTAGLFTGGKLLIGLYLGRSGIASAYGAAGSLVVVLVWVYYSAQILYFGAEFTKVSARARRARVRPAEFAEPAPAPGRRAAGRRRP
jgi:membrane protein